MRRLLVVFAVIAVGGAGLLVYESLSRPTNELEDCSTGVVPAPTVDRFGPEPWPGTPIALSPVAESPDTLASTPAGSQMLIASRLGEVYQITDEEIELLWTEPAILSEGPEQGLLDVLADQERGLIYTSLTRDDGYLEIRTRPIDSPTSDSYGVMLVVEQPHEFHNGGGMQLDLDGHLFVSLGDGGPSGDLYGHPQNLDTLKGSILRIIPEAEGFTIPSDNPLGPNGDPVAHWAYGLRNAWRISIDPDTGVLWIADVGNWCIEEINVMPAAKVDEPWNFGWSALEGTSRGKGRIPDGHVPPLIEYDHSTGGCAVIGGHVYRGSAVPELQGLYLFSDYCAGRVLALDIEDGDVVAVFDLGVETELVTSLERTREGEIWVMSQTQGVFELVADSDER